VYDVFQVPKKPVYFYYEQSKSLNSQKFSRLLLPLKICVMEHRGETKKRKFLCVRTKSAFLTISKENSRAHVLLGCYFWWCTQWTFFDSSQSDFLRFKVDVWRWGDKKSCLLANIKFRWWERAVRTSPTTVLGNEARLKRVGEKKIQSCGENWKN
jgi:hypothetical protein